MLMSYGRFIYSTARDLMWPRVLGTPLGSIWRLTGSPMIATVVLAIVLAFSFLYYPLMLRRHDKVKPPVSVTDAIDSLR